jgi:large subunit ribosomal protein L17
MRHRSAGRPLGRNASHRHAMWKNMVTSLLEHGRITTTLAKAKELRPRVEKTITRGIGVVDLVAKPVEQRSAAEVAKILHEMRMAARLVHSRAVLKRLFEELAPKFKDRPGGYTRIVKTAPRAGDGAPMAIVELVS